jgi:general nucleoside transport system permease protein
VLDTVTSIDYWDAVIRVSSPIALAALACLICSRAGILYVGVEGVMVISAFFAIGGAIETDSVWLGVVAGVAAGIVGNLVLGFLSMTLRMGDVVAGLVVHVGAVGLTGFLLERLFPGGASVGGDALTAFWPATGSSVGDLVLHQQPLVYAAILGAVALRLAWSTRVGLVVRSGGESIRAAQSYGIDVVKLRFAVLAAAGVPIGLAGATLGLALVGNFDPDVGGGRGFIALVCVMLGAWKPMLVLAAAAFFGSAYALQFRLEIAGIGDWIQILPFVLTLIALGVVRWSSQGPADEGRDPRPA